MPSDADEASVAVTARMRQWARRSAADYLSKYASSTENLRKVIARRAARRHPETGQTGAALLAEQAVDFCKENGFIDDVAFAEAKVKSESRKGRSRRGIAAALAAKGVNREISGAALLATDDLAAAAALARRRRIGPWRREPLDVETRRREFGVFGRGGFGGDVIAKVTAMTVEEAEEALRRAEERN